MKIQMTITINDDGSCTVNGPLDNKAACYGLLECARDVVKDWNDAKAREQIIAPVRMPLPPFPGSNGPERK
jgi:hypothetical protein